ncbi:MAG: RNA polymerase sigma factor [Oscillospiraceae bacterium]|nr:RNA polymerase sigma factor [Oscillospiraceae bacterium]
MRQETERKRSAEESYQAFCAGEQSAFDALMAEFQQPLIFFLQGYVHSPEAAEDLAEEAFVELLLHKGRFKGQSSFKTFLFSVARHKAIDFLRREQRRRTVPLEEIAELGMRDDGHSPEEALEEQERALLLLDAMAQLPQEYGEVLWLLYVERLHYEEIAQVMHKKTKQIDNLAYRARNALRTIVGKEAVRFEEL